MLVNAIKLTRTYPCLAEPGMIVVMGEPDAPIDGVLPLLNAIVPNVVSYNPMAGVMTLRRQPGLLTLYPQRVTLTQVANAEELRTVGIEPGLVVANFVIPSEKATTPFTQARRAMQEHYMGEIAQRFATPVLQIPLLPAEVKGLDALAELGDKIYSNGAES
jgi:anion-transporting  ArsA/GET3 family ATPase